MTLIDLDLVRPVDDAPTPRARRFGRRPLIKGLAALAVLLTAATGGSAPAAAPGLEKVLTVTMTQDSRIAIGGDALYISSVDTDFGTHVERRSLVGEGPHWSLDVPSADGMVVPPTADVLLVGGFDVTTTRALDARTGREMWRHGTGAVVVASDDIALLLVIDRVDHEAREMQAVALRTGERIWSRRVDPDADWQAVGAASPDAFPRYLVIVDPDGTVTTVRVTDGRVLASRRLDRAQLLTEDGYRDDFVEVTAVGETVYLAQRRDGTASMTAYGLTDLAERWRTTAGASGHLVDCGPVVCVATDDDARWTAVDPRTGQQLWTEDRWSELRRWDGDRLLASPTEPGETVLLDPWTGRQVGRAGTGRGIEGSTRLFLRNDSTTDPGRLWVTEFGGPRQQMLGQLDVAATELCSTTGAYVTCPSLGDTVSVWRVRA